MDGYINQSLTSWLLQIYRVYYREYKPFIWEGNYLRRPNSPPSNFLFYVSANCLFGGLLCWLSKKNRFLNYALFVSFFPQLIAGPIVHHRELVPQFSKVIGTKMDSKRFMLAILIFSLGLFKKVVIADSLADIANPFYLALSNGETLSALEAWLGALSYTFQLYFDFSGYSDMAIGLGFFFGIRLPLNFNAPYKAENIIEFWRRWHMTLSQFLRDYLYIPLGSRRKGSLLK